jgi:prenyltransferase beta subunit
MRLLLIVFLAVLVAAPPASAASRASWLAAAQNRDGGFGTDPGRPSSQLMTGWAALGLAAAGRNPLDVRRGGRSPVDAMRRTLSGVRDIGGIERTILVLRAAGLNPRFFGSRNLVREVLARQRADGSISGFVSYTSFGVMAWRASAVPSGDRNLRRAVAWLLRQQNADGGWSTQRRGRPSAIDDTGYALQALASAGRRSSRAVSRGAAYLARVQNRDGGFPLGRGGASNAQSTAYAVQGLVAAGRSLPRRGGRTPLGYLASLTESSGRVRYSRSSTQTPVWVTAQVMAAMARKPFPLRAVRRRSR